MTDILDTGIDEKLVAEAKRLGIDVRSALDLELKRLIEKERKRIAWREENRAAIEELNRWVEENGLWYEGLRKL